MNRSWRDRFGVRDKRPPPDTVMTSQTPVRAATENFPPPLVPTRVRPSQQGRAAMLARVSAFAPTTGLSQKHSLDGRSEPVTEVSRCR